MVHHLYIEEFPERLHHPKENSVLFPRLRAGTHDIDATLDELGRQHASSHPHLDYLKTLLGRMQADIPGAAQEFAEQDWAEVAASFAENNDPLLDDTARNSEWFRQFYRRLITQVPEPWGVGERR